MLLEFQASLETPDTVRQNKGSKQDWQKLHHDLRIRKEKHSDDQQDTSGKKIQDRSIQFLQNIDQNMIKPYKYQKYSKYKLADHIDHIHRHKCQARSKSNVYDRCHDLTLQKIIDLFPHSQFLLRLA